MENKTVSDIQSKMRFKFGTAFHCYVDVLTVQDLMMLLDLIGTRQTRFGNWFPQTAQLYSRLSAIGESSAYSSSSSMAMSLATVSTALSKRAQTT